MTLINQINHPENDLYKFSQAQDIARIQANMLATPNPPDVSENPNPTTTLRDQVGITHRQMTPTTNKKLNQQSQQIPLAGNLGNFLNVMHIKVTMLQLECSCMYNVYIMS